jgi:hypothetical protein
LGQELIPPAPHREYRTPTNIARGELGAPAKKHHQKFLLKSAKKKNANQKKNGDY